MAYIYPLDKSGTTFYRVYYFYKSKKIYVGLYETVEKAQKAYDYVDFILKHDVFVSDYEDGLISFSKFIVFINFRNSGMYISTPIFIYDNYFNYYVSKELFIILDLRDLLFFSTYKIFKRGNYLYTTIGYRQESILNRFGILPNSVLGKDYYFKNDNRYDLRRDNLVVVTHYTGVHLETKFNKPTYVTRIFTDRYIVVGHYESELLAAIAYNKALNLSISLGFNQHATSNNIPYLTKSEYQALYDRLTISPRIADPSPQNRVMSNNNYRGVSKDGTGYRASIGYRKKLIYLGIYTTTERAAQAYNFASLYLYGPKGYVNPISPLTYSSDELKIAAKLKHANVLKQQKKE